MDEDKSRAELEKAFVHAALHLSASLTWGSFVCIKPICHPAQYEYHPVAMMICWYVFLSSACLFASVSPVSDIASSEGTVANDSS